MARFRPRRIRRLMAELPEIKQPDKKIIDIGGAPGWWEFAGIRGKNILIVNLDNSLQEITEKQGFSFSCADGRALPYRDKEFDLAVSNSVIEHAGTFNDQIRFAAEIRRCAKAFYLQTPHKWFFVEPHIIGPFIHWLPYSIYRRLVRWLSVWGWVNKPTQQQVDQFLGDTRLLTRREMQALFPGLEVRAERFLGMTKSFEIIHRT